MSPRVRQVLVSAGAVVLLAACGGAAAPAPSSSPAGPAVAVSLPPASARTSSPASSAAPAAASAAAKPAGPAAAKPAASGLTKISISYAVGAAHMPIWYAKDKGIYQRNGLDADIQNLGAGPPAFAALQSNGVQVVDLAGSTVAGANANGADAVVLATLTPAYPYVLEAPAAVKTADDLRGKGIAVRAIGDATDIAARLALQHFNLVPGKDVNILAFNTEGARLAAVQAGQICCTVAQPQDAQLLEAQGSHQLMDFATLGLPTQAVTVIAVMRDYLTKNPATVQAFMDSFVQSIAAVKADRAGTVPLIKTYVKLDDDKVAEMLYDYFAGKVIPDNPVAAADQFKDGIAILAAQDDKLKTFTMDRYVDGSFLQKAMATVKK
jgi:ABC-type nitrate/sulfonate/bicarbonate transport system substrate-binding protein